MYDFLLEMFSTLFRHGFSVSSAVAIVFLLLRQRRIKKRLSRFFPWMFDGDNEVRAYMGNQIIIMKNQERMMDFMGVEHCASGSMTRLNEPVQKNLNTLSKLSRPDYVQAIQEVNMKTIVLNAGHGGKDPGAIGVSGRTEKEFNLRLVLLLEHLLKDKFNVVLTRSTDVFMELDEISKFANKQKADAFISVHANSLKDTSNGTETFYTRSDSKKLADTVHKHMVMGTGFRDRGVKVDNLSVTKKTTMPAILLEVGFLSNVAEESQLFNSYFQDRVAKSIVQGLYEYFEIKEETNVNKSDLVQITVAANNVVVGKGFVVDGVSYAPVRLVAEALGGKAYWDNKIKQVDIYKGE